VCMCMCVSSYYYMCLVLNVVSGEGRIGAQQHFEVPNICVLVLLYMCVYTAIYVLHTALYVYVCMYIYIHTYIHINRCV